MSLDIGAAITEGVRRLRSRDGIALVGAFLVVGVLSSVAGQSLLVAFAETMLELAQSPDAPPGTDVETLREQVQQARANAPLALDVPVQVALGLVFLLGIVAEALRIVAIRIFYGETGGRPDGLTRNLVFATVNGFLGGIVVYALVGIGLLLLVVPGIFLAIALFFVRQEIAVEDRNFIDAMAESWALTRGNRLNLLAFVLILGVLFVLSQALLTLVVGVTGSNVAGTAINSIVSSAVAVFSVAATTRAYAQLKGEGPTDAGGTDEPETVGALGPDDLPEP